MKMTEKFKLDEIYKNRRRNLINQIKEGVVMINVAVSAPDLLLYDKNIRYLVGQVPNDSILLLSPHGIEVDRDETLFTKEVGRGVKTHEILFLRELSSREEITDGRGLTLQEYEKKTGVQTVKWLSDFNEILSRALLTESLLWANLPSPPSIGKPLTSDHIRLNQIRERFHWIQIKNVAPIIHLMRWKKDSYEIDCLHKAFEIHSQIFEKIMSQLKPGTNESLGDAIYNYEINIRDPLKVSGKWSDLYLNNLIVASGKNTTIGHYMVNNQIIQDNDLVLIDAGVEYNGYSSDITRTFPANGKFTPRQRELYQIVLDAQKKAIATMKVGSNQRTAHVAVFEYFKQFGLDKYNYGKCGHAVGLNIHDANGWGINDQPYEDGTVVVIEPYIAIPEEGIGIRIEDGVVIRKNGVELLPGPPKEIDDIEKLRS